MLIPVQQERLYQLDELRKHLREYIWSRFRGGVLDQLREQVKYQVRYQTMYHIHEDLR